MRTLLALLVIAAAGLLAPVTNAADRGTLTVQKSRFGTVLFDGRGYVLYGFTKDPRGRSACYGACAAAWPPFIVARAPKAGAGTKASLLGTTRRKDGKLQVTYAGRPLYYYVHDGRGQILCHNVSEFGGLWLVQRPSGKLVR